MRASVFACFLLAGCGLAFGAGAKAPHNVKSASFDTLDQKKIQSEYADGDFENITQILEDFRLNHTGFRPSDSLLMAKYLGVIYVSNPATREKGKYWLYRMLQLDPTADLVDMYVGEEVDHVFEKVREEFIVRRNYRGINDVKLAKAVSEGRPGEDQRKDTVVVRDTVRLHDSTQDALPERQLKDFRHGWTFNLNAGVGMKFLDKTEWAGTEQQTEFRAAFDFRQRRWPINIAVDFVHSASARSGLYDSVNGDVRYYRQTTDELNAGVRKIFDYKMYSMRPFVGGGFGYISTSLSSFNFQQGNTGAWLDGGVYWELERHFNLGAEGLWSWASIPVKVDQANAGGLHAEMILGYHW